MWLAGSTGRKNDAKNWHLCTVTQICQDVSSQLRHVWTIGKTLVKQQCVPHMPAEYGELGPLAAEIGSVVWGTPTNFNGFHVLPLLLQRRRSPEANARQNCAMVRRWRFVAFCVLYFQRTACSTFQTCILNLCGSMVDILPPTAEIRRGIEG